MSGTVMCPTCRASAHVDDVACGACGAALARLRVINGRQRIDAGTRDVVVHVDNSGVVPAALVLRRIDLRQSPPWLVASPPVDVAIEVPPGATVPLSFTIDPSQLPVPGSLSLTGHPGRFVVPLVTSLVRFENDPASEHVGRAVRRVLAVEFATSGRVSVSPSQAVVPCIAIEFLAAGFKHGLRIHNDGGHALCIVAATVVTDGPIEARLVPDPSVVVVQSGATIDVDVVVQPAAGVDFDRFLHAGAVDAVVEVTLAMAEGPARTARLRLTVGKGPDVVVLDNPALLTRGRTRRGAVVVHNPGDWPVRLLEVGLEPGANDGNWLRLVEQAPRTLQPGERVSVGFIVDPDRRAERALDQPWGERYLLLKHDGWQPDIVDRTLRIPVRVELGRSVMLDQATLGVDFGTSNSSSSMFHGPTGTLHALPLDRHSGREALASLMFFVGDDAGDAAGLDGFLVGAAAENAAPQNFTNLVRQLKSVLARDPDTAWHFVDDSGHLIKRTTSALLTSFFGELKRRAEDGLRALPLDFLQELGLIDIAVRFRHAVFSHPVGADDSTLQALYVAATAVDLCDVDFETFKRERCVDEALAAVLAWVYLAAAQPASQLALTDDDRLLCFDAGGGTCDVAAVAIGQLASFRQHPGRGAVSVQLLANGGAPRFGGSDIDRLVAGHLLDEIGRQPAAATVDIDGIRRALSFPSFESWRRSRGEAADTGAARVLFHRASDLLRAAERVKKALSDEASSSFVAVLDDWPRRISGGAGGRCEITMTRDRLNALCQSAFDSAAALVDPVLEAAGWRADDVTTVLFTGQTSRIPGLREVVLQRLASRRSSGRPGPFVVEPGRVAAFDVKRCVAQGAAILGDSRRGGGGWLHVSRRASTALSAALQVRRGPLLVDIAGLEAGRLLPARGSVELFEAGTRLVLYRTGAACYEATWTAPRVRVDVVVEAEGKVMVIAGDETVCVRRSM